MTVRHPLLAMNHGADHGGVRGSRPAWAGVFTLTPPQPVSLLFERHQTSRHNWEPSAQLKEKDNFCILFSDVHGDVLCGHLSTPKQPQSTSSYLCSRPLGAGVPADKAGEENNPFCEWIGASIRADPWGYVAPGWPERAAEMACRDAFLTHRREGIYGEMFFSSAIAAAFAVDHPVEALKIGLTEIPEDCALAKAVRWALETAPEIRSYRDARAAVDERFAGMNAVHTINNACLTIWGLTIGGTNLTKVISQTVAMGLDNDCTAATAGSIVGAVIGKKRIPSHWYRKFNNTVHSYLVGRPRFTITGLVRRFSRQASRVHRAYSQKRMEE